MKFGSAWKWKWLPGWHPAVDLLVARMEGGLSLRAQRQVESHLQACAACRQEAHRIAEALTAPPLPQNQDRLPEALLEEVFEDVCAGMRAWRSLGGADADSHGHGLWKMAANRRLAQALEFYFGGVAARHIERSARRGTPERQLLPATKPLFSVFLGRRAADALVRRIVSTGV